MAIVREPIMGIWGPGAKPPEAVFYNKWLSFVMKIQRMFAFIHNKCQRHYSHPRHSTYVIGLYFKLVACMELTPWLHGLIDLRVTSLWNNDLTRRTS